MGLAGPASCGPAPACFTHQSDISPYFLALAGEANVVVAGSLPGPAGGNGRLALHTSRRQTLWTMQHR